MRDTLLTFCYLEMYRLRNVAKIYYRTPEMSLSKCVALEEEIKKNPELKVSDIDILREWCKKQPHLPNISDVQLAILLHSNYYQIEPTKSTIENYFTIRTHAPEIFSNRDMRIKNLRTCKITHIVLREKSKEGYIMILSRLVDFEPSHFILADEINHGLMVLEEHIYSHGTTPGYISIMDASGFSFGHLGRLHPVIIKKALTYIQEANPIRLKAVYILNSSPAVETVYNMIKPLINKELQKLLHFHSSIDSAKAYIPIDALPDECRGKFGPIGELREASVKKIEDFREWFLEDEKVNRVNESLRIGESKTSSDLFGVDGSFKKLELD